MMNTYQFFKRFFIGILIAAIPAIGAHLVAKKIGEIGISNVVERQLAEPNGTVLFLSGINQQAYPYKVNLMTQVEPSVISLGSSRAMQFRGEFVKGSFTNLGGAIQGVTDLEDVAKELAQRPKKVPFVFLFVDPWWFNAAMAGNGGARQPDFPDLATPSLIFMAGKLLSKGNWILKSAKSSNLGIQSILTGNGFSRDGSYYYTSLVNGTEPSADVGFSDTLGRIKDGNRRFEKSTHASAPLLARACSAIAKIKANAGSMVMIAPPFASTVAQAISNDAGYAYMNEAFDGLKQCAGDGGLHLYPSMAQFPESSDCEFVDGFHGGDVVYARMLMDIAQVNPQAKDVLDTTFMADFIQANTGFAAGMERSRSGKGKEPDFLKLGCKK